MDQQAGQPWPPPPYGWPPAPAAGPVDGPTVQMTSLLGGLTSAASLLPGLVRLSATAVATNQRDVPAAWVNSGWLMAVQLLVALLGSALCIAGFSGSRRGAGVGAAALFVAGAALGWALADAGYWAIGELLA